MPYGHTVYRGARLAAAVAALQAASGRVAFLDVGDSNQAQATTEGHWINTARIAKSVIGWQPYGSRIYHGWGAGGSYDAGTGDMGATGYQSSFTTPVEFEGDLVGGSSLVIARALVATSLDPSGEVSRGSLRFMSQPSRLKQGNKFPRDGASNISGSTLIGSHDASNFFNWNAAGGTLALTYLIPPTTGGTMRLAVRTITGFTQLASVDISTQNANPVDLELPFTASPNGQAYAQCNRIFTDQSTGEIYILGSQMLRAGVTGRDTGPGGYSWTLWWGVGGNGLANFAYDLSGQTQTAIAETLRQASLHARHVVVRIKHKGNDVNKNWASVLLDGSKTGAASNTKAGYKNNARYVTKVLMDAWLSLGHDRNELTILFGAYHPQTGRELQQDFEAAEREIADEDAAIGGDRVVSVSGWSLTTPAEMTSLGWYNGGDTAHLVTAGFNGFNTRELQGVIAAASVPVAPPTLQATCRLATADLLWTAAEGAESYNVYRDGSLVANVLSAGWVDPNPIFGRTHTYTVRGLNAVGEGVATTVNMKAEWPMPRRSRSNRSR